MLSESLEAFLAVAETHSFSEAAIRMYTTQPTVSRQVRALENELHTELFVRGSRHVELTAAGQHVYTFAAEQQKREDELLQQLSLSAGRSHTIRLAITPLAFTCQLTDCLQAFSASFPEYETSIQETPSSGIDGLLESGCELAICRKDSIRTDCHSLDLMHDKLVVILPAAHPLAGKGTISMKDLENERFLLLPHHTSTHQTTVKLCRRAGFVPNIFYAGTQFSNVLELVRHGFGISLVFSGGIPEIYRNDIASVDAEELKDETILISLLHPKRRKLTPQAEAFRAFVNGRIVH